MKFSNKRYQIKQCPCGKRNHDGKFIPFQDYEDKGHCYSCGKTFFPKQESPNKLEYIEKPLPLRTDYKEVEKDIWVKSVHENDNLSWFLSEKEISYYDFDICGQNNATIFWQFDINGRCMNGKKIIYDKKTGKRNKKYFPSFLYKKEDGYGTCFYMEQKIISFPNNTHINIVESEKTAIIAQHFNPDEIWLASGGSNGITKEKAQVLYGRNITVWLDCDEASRTSAARSYKNLKQFHNDVIIKDPEPNLNDGTDLADIILRDL